MTEINAFTTTQTFVTLRSGRVIVGIVNKVGGSADDLQQAKDGLIDVVGGHKPSDSGYVNLEIDGGWAVVPIREVESVVVKIDV